MRGTLDKITQIIQYQLVTGFYEELQTGPGRRRSPPAAPPAARRSGEVPTGGGKRRTDGPEGGCGVRAPFRDGGRSPVRPSGRRRQPPRGRAQEGVATSPDPRACREDPAPVAGRWRSRRGVPERVPGRGRVRDQVQRGGPREAGVPDVPEMRGMAALLCAVDVAALPMLWTRIVRSVVRPPRRSPRSTDLPRPELPDGPRPGSLRAAEALCDPLGAPAAPGRHLTHELYCLQGTSPYTRFSAIC